jgi:hypothetical protein
VAALQLAFIYLLKILITIIISLSLLFACQETAREKQAMQIITFFTNNPSQLYNLMHLQIVPRGTDTFIYGIDSLEIGLYLINFSVEDASKLRISNYLQTDSLLVKKGIKDIGSFKKSLIESAHKNLKLMSNLEIRSLNNSSYMETCRVGFVLKDRTIVYYLCAGTQDIDKLKKIYGDEVKIVNHNWIYLLEEQ